MFDLGWAELILIGIVALIVMGDDFPTMFRTLGRFTGQMRKMAREFSRAMEEAADDAGVKDVANTLKTAASPKSMGLDALNKAADNVEKWEAGMQRTGPKKTSKAADKAASTAKPSDKSDAAPAPATDADPAPVESQPAQEPAKTPEPGQ